MNKSRSASIYLRRLLLVTLYFTTFFSGVAQALSSSICVHYLCSFAMAGSATGWMVSDSRERGNPILHILQTLIMVFWPIVVPIYLVTTRGIRGLGFAIVHAIGLLFVLSFGIVATAIATSAV